MLVGQEARESVALHYECLYEHPRVRLGEEQWDEEWTGLQQHITETLVDAPKVNWNNCYLPQTQDFLRTVDRLKRNSGASGDCRVNELLKEAPIEDQIDIFEGYYRGIAAGDIEVADEQKTANLRRLHKKGDTTVRKNYRCISEQSHDYKVAEWSLMEVARREIDTCFPPEFDGFRKNRGCTIATLRLRSAVDEARFADKERVFFMFDVGAAFDTVVREINAAIYSELGCDPKWVAAQERLWSDMKGRMILDGHEIAVVHAQRGVAQGGRNSPTHYSVFTLLLYHKFKKDFPKVSQQWVADDAVFSMDLTDFSRSKSTEELYKLAYGVVEEYDRLHMHIAAQKTQAYLVQSQKGPRSCPAKVTIPPSRHPDLVELVARAEGAAHSTAQATEIGVETGSYLLRELI
eukprot:gene57434-biopygen12916